MIEVNELCVAYPDGTKAINNLSFKIEDGQSVAIVGANGAGKSTLMLTLVGIIPASYGNIRINNLEVKKNNLSQIRAQMGMVFQNPDDQLFMSKVYDDIAFGPRNYGFPEEEVEKRVSQVLTDLNAEHIRDKMPYKLSGGEKRIAAIACVLSMRPSIMLLDEPSSFLDPKARRNLIALLKNIPLTKVIATHDLDMAFDLCERVIVLQNSTLYADGEAKSILKNKELMEACGLELPLSCGGISI